MLLRCIASGASADHTTPTTRKDKELKTGFGNTYNNFSELITKTVGLRESYDKHKKALNDIDDDEWLTEAFLINTKNASSCLATLNLALLRLLVTKILLALRVRVILNLNLLIVRHLLWELLVLCRIRPSYHGKSN